MATVKTISIHIERLDKGFVMTQDGERTAIPTNGQVQDSLFIQFDSIVRMAMNPECKTCEVVISFTENPDKLQSA